jgi:hypothetical protein
MTRSAHRLVLVVLAALLPAQLFAQPAGRKVAVLVGIKSYDHAAFPDLRYAERDVEELAPILEAAGFRVTLLTSRSQENNRKPSLANIRAGLAEALKGVTKRDTVVVALAGHGVQPADAEQSYFCPSDSQPKDTATMLGLGDLTNQLTDSGAGLKLLLVDACRNDPQPAARSSLSLASVTRPRGRPEPGGVAALFSCSTGQRAYESDKAGGGHGIFFNFVIEGLRGAAADPKGNVTWGRLVEYVQENVEARVPEWIGDGVKQTPYEVRDLVGRPPVLATRPATPRSSVPPPAQPPAGPSLPHVRQALLELEAAILWSSVVDEWRTRRAGWQQEVASAVTPAQVAGLLTELETAVFWNAVAASWKDARPNWLQACSDARRPSDVARLMIQFEVAVSWEAVDSEWAQRRDAWMASLR